MSDEAVLRIILQDGSGKGGGPPPSPTPPKTPTPSPTSPKAPTPTLPPAPSGGSPPAPSAPSAPPAPSAPKLSTVEKAPPFIEHEDFLSSLLPEGWGNVLRDIDTDETRHKPSSIPVNIEPVVSGVIDAPSARLEDIPEVTEPTSMEAGIARLKGDIPEVGGFPFETPEVTTPSSMEEGLARLSSPDYELTKELPDVLPVSSRRYDFEEHKFRPIEEVEPQEPEPAVGLEFDKKEPEPARRYDFEKQKFRPIEEVEPPKPFEPVEPDEKESDAKSELVHDLNEFKSLLDTIINSSMSVSEEFFNYLLSEMEQLNSRAEKLGEEVPTAEIERLRQPSEPKGKDTVPAMLEPGEVVIPKDTVDRKGPEIDKLVGFDQAQEVEEDDEGKTQYMAHGGHVGRNRPRGFKDFIYRETGADITAISGGAGPFAMVSAIKDLKENIDKAVVGAIKEGVGAVADVGMFAAEASADPSVPIAKFSESISKAGEEVNKYIPIVGYLITATGEAGKALAGLMQAIDKTAERYSEYSPEISQAQAIAEVRQTLGDLRRAQEIGLEMSRYIQAQADVQQRFEDIKIRLLTKVLPVVTRILEAIDSVMATGEGISETIGSLLQPLAELSGFASMMVSMQQDDRLPDVPDPTSIIMGKGPGGDFAFPRGNIGINQLD